MACINYIDMNESNVTQNFANKINANYGIIH